MLSLKEFCLYLETLFESFQGEDYCPNGLQVEGKQEIKKAAFAVSASLESIEKAALLKSDVLVVHHGIFWNRDPYPIIGVRKKKIEALIGNKISLIAYHLPMDAHQTLGNNWRAASDLGWVDLQPFGLFNKSYIGVKGKIEKTDREAFRETLEQFYKHPAYTVYGGKDYIETAALISGGAYRSLADAAHEPVDCFITGNFDEPAYNIANEEKINFYALGHTATERVGPKALKDHVEQALGIESVFIDTDNPF